MNTEKCTVAQLAELNLCHYITMRRGDSNTDFTAHSMEAILDYTSQAPAALLRRRLRKGLRPVCRRNKKQVCFFGKTYSKKADLFFSVPEAMTKFLVVL